MRGRSFQPPRSLLGGFHLLLVGPVELRGTRSRRFGGYIIDLAHRGKTVVTVAMLGFLKGATSKRNPKMGARSPSLDG